MKALYFVMLLLIKWVRIKDYSQIETWQHFLLIHTKVEFLLALHSHPKFIRDEIWPFKQKAVDHFQHPLVAPSHSGTHYVLIGSRRVFANRSAAYKTRWEEPLQSWELVFIFLTMKNSANKKKKQTAKDTDSRSLDANVKKCS